jgi:hypothetical protein
MALLFKTPTMPLQLPNQTLTMPVIKESEAKLRAQEVVPSSHMEKSLHESRVRLHESAQSSADL